MAKREDFAVGGEQIEVERRPRSGAVVSARVSGSELEQLQDIADQRSMTISQVVREALERYLQGVPTVPWLTSPWAGATASFAMNLLVPTGPLVHTDGAPVLEGKITVVG